MKTIMVSCAALAALGAAATSPAFVQDPAKERLRASLKDTGPAGSWIYDDVAAGFAQAQKTKKPLLIVFR